MQVMTIYRYVMAIMKMTKIMIACVAIVSMRFRSKERGTRVKDCAKNGPEPKIPLLVVPRYFFAPKLHGNACYAGYGNVMMMICLQQKVTLWSAIRTTIQDCLVPRPHYYARPMRFGSRGPRKFLRPRQTRRSETFCLTWGGAFGSGRAVNNFSALMKNVQQPWRVQRINRAFLFYARFHC